VDRMENAARNLFSPKITNSIFSFGQGSNEKDLNPDFLVSPR